MCNAIYAAAVLAALIAGLTLLRIREGRSPNAELLTDLLNDKPAGIASRPADSGEVAPRPPVALDTADFPC